MFFALVIATLAEVVVVGALVKVVVVVCGSAEVVVMGALGTGEGYYDMERAGKNSGKIPPLCTGELDTTPSLHLGGFLVALVEIAAGSSNTLTVQHW